MKSIASRLQRVSVGMAVSRRVYTPDPFRKVDLVAETRREVLKELSDARGEQRLVALECVRRECSVPDLAALRVARGLNLA
jgi:hypothetical protein